MNAIIRRLTLSTLLSTTTISASDKVNAHDNPFTPQTVPASALAADLASAGYTPAVRAFFDFSVPPPAPATLVGDAALRMETVIAAELARAGYVLASKTPFPAPMAAQKTPPRLVTEVRTADALRADLAAAGYVQPLAPTGVAISMSQ